MGKFKVVFYVKGCFVKKHNLRYGDGEVCAFTSQDLYYWSFFKACDLVKSIDPECDVSATKIWWKHDEGSREQDLKSFKDDGDAIELVVYAVGSNCEVEIFCEARPNK